MENNNRYGLVRRRIGKWRLLRDGDFEEQDVWDVLDDYGDQCTSKTNQTSEPSFSAQSLPPSAPRVIPRAASGHNRNSSSRSRSITRSESKGIMNIRQHSAPVNMLDRSRIRNKSKEAAAADADDRGFYDDDDRDDEDDEGSDENVSPEEYFMARSRSSSFSVIEGNGRTLKGRDLSRVRNAVLKKTGFLE